MALVKALTTVFVEGSRRKEGSVFSYNGPMTPELELIEAEKAPAASSAPDKAPDAPPLSNKEMKALLDAAGIEYAGNASNQVLADLLKETQANVAPAASSAPDKSTQI